MPAVTKPGKVQDLMNLTNSLRKVHIKQGEIWRKTVDRL